MMSFTTTFFTLAALASTALALPVPAADNVISKRYSGVRMTYYDTSVGLGACGNLNQNSAWTVALNSAQFGGGYPSPECGKTITISMGGKTAQAVIQDACPSCPYGGLDLSPSLFQHFADLGAGVIHGDWDYGSGAPPPPPPPPPPPEPTTTWQAPTSTYVAPTTSWTPEPSTSTTPPPPPPSSTYTPPTTSAAPPTSSHPAASSSVAPSSSAAPSSSSAPAPSSSSSTPASSSVSAMSTGVQSQSLLAAIMSTPTASSTGASAAASGTAGTQTDGEGQDGEGNLQMLSNVIVNLGRLVVMAA